MTGPAAAAQDAPKQDLGTPPAKCGDGGGGCYGRDAGPNFMDDTSLGDFKISPHLVHVGETITGRIKPQVHFGENVLMNFPKLGADGVTGLQFVAGEPDPTTRPTSPDSPGGHPTSAIDDVCQSGAPTRTVTTCTWKAGTATKGWTRPSAIIGNPPARGVEQDYFAVSADGWGISGRVSLATGRGMAGVKISIAGGKVLTTNPVTTNASGEYDFLVTKGTYKVTASAAVCVIPKDRGRCVSSTQVKTPGSRTVDFNAASEGVIDGTVHDAAGKPANNVTVRIIGRHGKDVTTDNDGYFRAEVPSGTYTVAASRKIDVAGKDKAGKPITTSKVETFCSADVPRKCPKTKTVTVPPDATLRFGQGCEAKKP